MRVLHCIWNMGGGGAERQLAYLAQGLSQLGVDVHVALLRGGPNMKRLEASGATIHIVRVAGKYDPTLPLRLARLVRRLRADVMHTWLAQMDIAGGIAARLTGTPWVMSERSSALAYPPTWLYRLRGLAARMPAAIVSNSRGGDEYWSTRVPARIVRRIIPNSVPLAEIAGAAPVPATDVRPLILFVGRFSDEKNLPTLIAALADVLPKHDAIATFCGDGPMRDEVRNAIEAAGIADRVLLTGYVDDVWSWMRRAAVYVSVGFFEGDPNAVKEAIAAGCPVVLSDIPAHRELVGGDDAAMFVEPHSVAAVVAGVESVIVDRAAAAERASRARTAVVACSPERVAMAYRDLYRELIGVREPNS